jgi:hypothetical protein
MALAPTAGLVAVETAAEVAADAQAEDNAAAAREAPAKN